MAGAIYSAAKHAESFLGEVPPYIGDYRVTITSISELRVLLDSHRVSITGPEGPIAGAEFYPLRAAEIMRHENTDWFDVQSVLPKLRD